MRLPQRLSSAELDERLLGALLFLAALTLYTATLAPGLLWGGGDFAIFQARAYFGATESEMNIFGHPLWIVLAHPFTWLPVRDPAWRANFASAVFAAAGLLFFFLSACYLTHRKSSALLATTALALSHTFWTYAVMPKVYSLNALLLALCFYLLLRWRDKGSSPYLVLFAFLYSVSFLNHLVMATAAAGFAAFIGITLWPHRRARKGWMPILLAALFFGLGLLPYLYLTAQAGTTGAIGGTIAGFMGGLGYAFTHPVALLMGVGWGIALGLYQFPLLTFVGVLGLYRLWGQDRGMAAAIGLIVLGTWAFLLGALDPRAGGVYVWNLHYYLQAYVAFALAITPGFDEIWERWEPAPQRAWALILVSTIVVPVLAYALAPIAARPFLRNIPDFRPLPGRDNLRYVLSPWKHNEYGPRKLSEEILAALPPNSVFFADYSIWAMIYYLQRVEQARPDVELIFLRAPQTQVPVILPYRDHPSLYLADTYRYYDVEGISEHFEIVPAGPIYRLVPREE